mmetsp:Transcript_16884/g.53826  ORF Transcript_16884/g.53826 Transcript_16884/m.53826 type:complete len:249 (+) Transcript_16884:364-1110(+)
MPGGSIPPGISGAPAGGGYPKGGGAPKCGGGTITLDPRGGGPEGLTEPIGSMPMPGAMVKGGENPCCTGMPVAMPVAMPPCIIGPIGGMAPYTGSGAYVSKENSGVTTGPPGAARPEPHRMLRSMASGPSSSSRPPPRPPPLPPPRVPRPPTLPPLHSSLGMASLTSMRRPWKSWYCLLSSASTDRRSAKVTNPKPRGRRVMWSCMMTESVSRPNFSKKARNEASVTSWPSPPAKHLRQAPFSSYIGP